jgi:hypothetical protein
MILYSTRARISGYAFDALGWANEVGKLVSSLGTPVEVAARVGGGQDLVWLSRFSTMAELDAQLAKIQQSREYQATIKHAVDKGFFDPASIDTGIWRTL